MTLLSSHIDLEASSIVTDKTRLRQKHSSTSDTMKSFSLSAVVAVAALASAVVALPGAVGTSDGAPAAGNTACPD